jgi:vacuolar-type H+-ATPase subunit F/Vma7
MAYHVIGDADTILGFGFAGVPGTAADAPDAARKAFADRVADGSLRILILTHKVAAMVDEELTAHRLSASPPFVVEIPDLWRTKLDRKTLVELIQEAVGIKISGDM